MSSSCLLHQFKCYFPDTFVVSFKTHHNSASHFSSKSREPLHIRAECILTTTSRLRLTSATSSVLDIEKLFCCCTTFKFSTPAKLTNFCCLCSAVSQSSSPTPSSKSFAYRPAIILPGLGNNTKDYEKLALLLKDYGVPTVVVKVSRFDWFRNAAGLLDANYWSGTLCPRPVLDWYFKKMEEALSEANDIAEGGPLSLIGHSAGGWLARVYIQEFGISNMSLLLTLGTPHLPPPKGLPGVIDQTRGLLSYVEKYCAKPVYTQELRYVCVAGRYIQGARLLGGATANENDSEMVAVAGQSDADVAAIVNTSKPDTRTWRARVIGQGYKQVCGEADAWGDGVVPVISAHLEGALNVTLEGVYHSPVGSDDVTRPWSAKLFRSVVVHQVARLTPAHGFGPLGMVREVSTKPSWPTRKHFDIHNNTCMMEMVRRLEGLREQTTITIIVSISPTQTYTLDTCAEASFYWSNLRKVSQEICSPSPSVSIV